MAREYDALVGVPHMERPDKQESLLRRLASVVKETASLAVFSFGGPPVHVALAHDRFVYKKKWLTDERFLETFSIVSAIPGPSSTQLMTSMGLFRAGPLGGLVAIVFWILPSAVIMTLAGLGARSYLQDGLPSWMAGLAPAAVSLVVIAAVRLWQKSCGDDMVKCFIASATAFLVLATTGLSSLTFPVIMATGGLIYLLSYMCGLATDVKFSNERIVTHNLEKQIGIHPAVAGLILVAWLAGMISLAVLQPQNSADHSLETLFFILYWMGSIIFGGGQVMLPMLLTDIVNRGWVSKEQFLAGFALVQSLPGPMFNISAYLGAILFGVQGAIVAACGLFGPGLILVFALLPLWERVRDQKQLQIFLQGVNAAATGLVVASIFLLWEKAVHNNASAAVGLATGIMVGIFSFPTPFAIVVGGVMGFVLTPDVINLGQQDFCLP